MKQSKRKLKLFMITVALAAGFGYAVYFLWGKVVSTQDLYIEKTKELLSLERKQEQISELEEKLSQTKEKREEIIESILLQEDMISFILKIEDIAKKAGLAHEVKIIRKITSESIEQERLAIRRARRTAKEALEEALRDKLPGVTFDVGLEGSYEGIIRFAEGVASLPYYTHIDRLNISEKRKGEAGFEENKVKASINLTVFTRD